MVGVSVTWRLGRYHRFALFQTHPVARIHHVQLFMSQLHLSRLLRKVNKALGIRTISRRFHGSISFCCLMGLVLPAGMRRSGGRARWGTTTRPVHVRLGSAVRLPAKPPGH